MRNIMYVHELHLWISFWRLIKIHKFISDVSFDKKCITNSLFRTHIYKPRPSIPLLVYQCSQCLNVYVHTMFVGIISLLGYTTCSCTGAFEFLVV